MMEETSTQPKLEASDELSGKIERVIDAINPALAADGGWVKYLGHHAGVVHLQMGGGCQGCAIATSSTMDGLRRILKERIPDIVDVVDVTDHEAGENPFYKSESEVPVL